MGVYEHAGRAVGDDGAGKFRHRDHAAFDVHVAIAQAGDEVTAVGIHHLGLFADGVLGGRANVGDSAAANGHIGVGDNFGRVDIDPTAVGDDHVGGQAAHGHSGQLLSELAPRFHKVGIGNWFVVTTLVVVCYNGFSRHRLVHHMFVVYEGGGGNVKRQIGRLSRFWQSGKLKSPLQSVLGQADLVRRIKLPMTIQALTTNQISIEDVKHNLLLYLQRVQAGEHFVIVVNNQPLAEIKPITILASAMRPMGLVAGEFELPSDFDDPLPNELLEAFEGV